MGTQTHYVDLNKTYFFAFKAEINQLNGLYKVQAILQSEEIEAFLEDPVQQIYASVNKLDIYDSSLLESKYRKEVFYKLLSIDNDKVYYFPDSLIIEYPISDFQKVMEYMVTLQFGSIDDPDELEALANELCQLSKRFIGIIPVTSIATYSEIYLTEQMIKDQKRSREIYRRTDPKEIVMSDLEIENAKLRTKVQKYEKIIINYEHQKNKLLNLVKIVNQ